MAHRLGSLVPVSPAREFRPGSGSNLGGGVWEDTFTAATPPVGNTKFMILHFAGVMLNVGDRLEVPLGNGDTDLFTAASGPDFWTRPIKGGAVAIRFVDAGLGTGKAPLTEYGRGEGIVNNGINGQFYITQLPPFGNANGDVFMLDTPYVDPPHFSPGGVCPPGARNWANADSLPPGVMRNAARSTGMFLEVSKGDFPKVSSCSAVLIGLTFAACHTITEELPEDQTPVNPVTAPVAAPVIVIPVPTVTPPPAAPAPNTPAPNNPAPPPSGGQGRSAETKRTCGRTGRESAVIVTVKSTCRQTRYNRFASSA